MTREFLATLAALAPDCCPVVAYGALLPTAALAVPVHGWVNLHFSLLPAWRGAAPVQRAILAGDEITGASTFQIEAGLDTGPVFGVVTEPIRPTDTAAICSAGLRSAGRSCCWPRSTASRTARSSRRTAATPMACRRRPSCRSTTPASDWTDPAFAVDRRVRACTPAPGAWTEFRGERIKLGPVRPLAEGALGRPAS